MPKLNPSKITLALIILSTIGVSGCASTQYVSNKEHATTTHISDPFIRTNYKAADALINQLNNQVTTTSPIIVATLVNIDDLNNSSTFGRLVSEQVSARFSQSNFTMLEMKFRGYVYMKQDQGELLLTREIKDVAKSHNAQAVIVGTYASSQDTVYVNLKVIQPNTNIVVAVHDYTFPIDTNLRTLTKSTFQKK